MELIINWMLTTYEANTAATAYWFGFILNHMVYVVPGMTFAELSRFFRKDRASSAKGGFLKIRIRARADELAELLPRAILLGDEEILTEVVANKGDGLERVIVERFAGEEWHKNSVPFFADGDATINGVKIQIKLNGAELTNEKILRRYFAA